ncbi:hypothetical protein LCGC14_1599750 [marine sediment metagenome]|uniref:Uncharacterized protein n=1 Tax=marine sediment metagenome TaxID=412755 RepID=A0A0F9LBJ3_9ZZZZ
MPEQVLIRNVQEIPVFDGAGVGREVVAITYSSRTVAPRTVFIDKEKDTPQERQRVIKGDLETVRAARAVPLDLP